MLTFQTINELLEKVSENIISVKIPEFFDFLSEIFKFYKADISKETVIACVKCIVTRIELDVHSAAGQSKQKNPFKHSDSQVPERSPSTKNSMAISKCWSIIFSILENQDYMKNYILDIEEELKYLFGLLSDPSRIEFDDDIIKAMKIIIINSNCISNTMQILFPYLKNSFEKQKFVFSELYEIIKAYCKISKEFVLSNQEFVNIIFGFGVKTIFDPDHCVNGAVYLVQLFLLLKGEDSNPYLCKTVPEVLEKVVNKIKTKGINKVMKRILYQVILASTISCYKITSDTLERMQLSGKVVDYFINLPMKRVAHTLERKLISVGLTNLLTQEELPDQIREKSPAIFTKIIDILVKTSLAEAKKAKK